MRFGDCPLAEAEGAILAHSLSVGAARLRKGLVLTAAHLEQLAQAGFASVVVARLDADDVHEDVAAATLAEALCGQAVRLGPVATGRCNLYATADGVLEVPAAAIAALNAIDESLTVATLPAWAQVWRGQMVATVKVIPYAAPRAAVDAARAAAAALRVHAFQPLVADLVQTMLPGLKPGVLDKTVAITRARLAGIGSRLGTIATVDHSVPALAPALRAAGGGDLLLIVGASAIADRADVIPAAIEAAGGAVLRFGMPVDPGNLLCLGTLDGRPVIGLPGCARSPRLNGLDWLLGRLAARVPVTSADIAAMGVGGLLEDVPERPLPRRAAEPAAASPPAVAPVIGAALLAAGRSSRMGADNKLLLPLEGMPLVAHAARGLDAAGCAGIVAVIAPGAGAVRTALEGVVTEIAVNPNAASGLSSSLQRAIEAAPDHWDAAFIALGDMPLVAPATLAALRAAFDSAEGFDIIVPTHDGRRGHPVLWGRRHWPWFATLSGDVGARSLLVALAAHVREVPVDDPGILADVDTPDAYQALLRTRAPSR